MMGIAVDVVVRNNSMENEKAIILSDFFKIFSDKTAEALKIISLILYLNHAVVVDVLAQF